MLLMEKPAKAARLCGLTRLTDTLHGRWIREMVFGQGDMTLLAHRGSYKTTCLSFAMAVMLVVYPRKNLLFLRKTDSDVLEVLRQVKLLLATDAMQELTGRIYGSPVQVLRGDMWSVNTDCYAAIRGAPQLLGLGTGGSMTGKHADIILTDDIVNLQDRISAVERKRICGVYQELQNIRNPGGRILNTGTPWHPDDAFRLMPPPEKYDCYQTGLLTKDAIAKLRAAMSPTLFAANYELRHIATGGGLFEAHPPETEDPLLLRDGIAHLDASYGGEDFTALTCGCIRGGRAYLYGRIWQKPVDSVLDEALSEARRLLCEPVYCETNGDKGYLAREIAQRGFLVRRYSERMNKHVKIATYLRKWWGNVTILAGTDRAYVDQILDYSETAAHDDAPDSASCVMRILDKGNSFAHSGQRSQAGQPKTGQGAMPLAGSRDSVPCGVWGNAPTVPRTTSMPNALNKGAGSEASLPVTLRVRRRAPNSLYSPLAHCRAKWARPNSLTSDHSWSCPQAGVSPLRRRRGGNENRRSLRSPPTPLRSAPPCNWSLITACENGNIRKTRNIF